MKNNPITRKITIAGRIVALAAVMAAPAYGNWIPVDNFETYTTGTLAGGATGRRWIGIWDGTANATIAADANNQVLNYWGAGTGGSAWRGAFANLATSFQRDISLANGASGTYFFQMRHAGGAIDNVFGVSDVAVTNTNSWQQYATTLSLTGTGNLRAFSGTGDVVLTTITPGDWFNVWIFVDNAGKTFRVGHSFGLDHATVHATAFPFGRRTGAQVTTIGYLAFTTLGTAPGIMVDNVFFSPGENSINPIPEPSTYALIFGALALIGVLVKRRMRKA